MHYSPVPNVWLDNLLNSCRLLVIQDLIDRRRGGRLGQLADDGDTMRYSFVTNGVHSSYECAYDLSQHADKLRYLDVYSTRDSARHFCAVFQGEARSLSKSSAITT